MKVTAERTNLKLEITLESKEEIYALRELCHKSLSVPYLVAEGKKLLDVDLIEADTWCKTNPTSGSLNKIFQELGKAIDTAC